ncbi:MAG: adenosylmethionine--8-amino-7-oxononanoate transaminase [Gammaproteobacteria bacterium]|nr:adenosylmethionine--8-amino-7-oxononanoate transaminase [Gammaproteobacteria bacterium]
MSTVAEMIAFDRNHIWHPYSALGGDQPLYTVRSAAGVRLTLGDGREVIDGISSWWCAIHGYNVPQLNAALEEQITAFSHVMFGGLTHAPAVELAQLLLELTPQPLQSVFFADSGSVAVEVALKMAIQYWHARGELQKQRFITLRRGYHGDTFGAMSVSDPDTGMHTIFQHSLLKQIFIPAPVTPFGEIPPATELAPLQQRLEEEGGRVAAVIVEPIVQGAGGMRFYSAGYLQQLRTLCDHFGVLLIHDEIATGFGRTGKMFASEHAAIAPDIMTVGKALTGGVMTLAATLTTEEVSSTLSSGTPGLFMHGPTFMANPLATAVALASTRLLVASPWQQRVAEIERGLKQGLAGCATLPGVAEVRVLGAIGVVELSTAVDLRWIQPRLVAAGVWIRPFGRLVYLMPPYIISAEDLRALTHAVSEVIAEMVEYTQEP